LFTFGFAVESIKELGGASIGFQDICSMCGTQITLYHNLNLGLMTKAKACKGAGQEGSLGVTSHAFGSVGECEGMNTHTPK